MLKKPNSGKTLTKKDIEQLLREQTVVIISAVESRIEKSEMRFNKKLDQLLF